jgi:hypothetical protein
MNTILRGEMFLLLVAGALFALVVLQFNGTIDLASELHKYI